MFDDNDPLTGGDDTSGFGDDTGGTAALGMVRPAWLACNNPNGRPASTERPARA